MVEHFCVKFGDLPAAVLKISSGKTDRQTKAAENRTPGDYRPSAWVMKLRTKGPAALVIGDSSLSYLSRLTAGVPVVLTAAERPASVCYVSLLPRPGRCANYCDINVSTCPSARVYQKSHVQI